MFSMRLKYLMLASLFCALIVVGTQIRIPFFFGVPLTMQTPMIQMAALYLPYPFGIYAVLLYLILGAAGFPVFSGGGGPTYFLGPTGGYLIGFFVATILLQVRRPRWISSSFMILTALTLHTLIIFLFGISWHSHQASLAFWQLAMGMSPFYLVALIKILLTFALIKSMLRNPRFRIKDQ